MRLFRQEKAVETEQLAQPVENTMMELARSIAGLLTWQWVVLILALNFHRPLRRLLDRIVGLRLGGEKGVQATLTTLKPGPGKVLEAEVAEQHFQKRLDAGLFVLRDARGNERAKLGVTDTNTTSLSLYDSEGKERMVLFVTPDGSSTVALYDDKKVRTLLARSEVMGVDGLSILGSDGRNGVNLLVSSEGHPSLDITDQRGRSLFSL